ncbi:MAG: iron transporter, partial [Frankiales bacterium]|nr:iron transporter [Frankiales bacterium]
REGFETAVFLLAAFNESDSPTTAGVGALLGILVAVGLGYAIYRGGVKLNLSKFFRATGVVLVLVAAGLVVSALHTAHEAGWLNAGQQKALDLSAVVRPGSVQSSLLTGILGIQERPTVIEVVGWLVYLIPLGLYVGWPPGRSVSRAVQARVAAAALAVCLVAGVLCLTLAPNRGAGQPATTFGTDSAQVLAMGSGRAEIASTVQSPAASKAAAPSDGDRPRSTFTATRTGVETRSGTSLELYTATATGSAIAGLPARVTLLQAAALNGGRLPLGAGNGASPDSTVAMSYRDVVTLTWWIEPETHQVVDLRWSELVTRTAAFAIGDTVLGTTTPVVSSVDPAQARDALAKAAAAEARLDDRHTALTIGVLLLLAAAGAAGWLIAVRRRARQLPQPTAGPARQLVQR